MKTDVIVIGAGIVGAACARECALRRLRVLVLDDASGGATGAGMGHLVAMDDNAAELELGHVVRGFAGRAQHGAEAAGRRLLVEMMFVRAVRSTVRDVHAV